MAIGRQWQSKFSFDQQMMLTLIWFRVYLQVNCIANSTTSDDQSKIHDGEIQLFHRDRQLSSSLETSMRIIDLMATINIQSLRWIYGIHSVELDFLDSLRVSDPLLSKIRTKFSLASAFAAIVRINHRMGKSVNHCFAPTTAELFRTKT